MYKLQIQKINTLSDMTYKGIQATNEVGSVKLLVDIQHKIG
jgi:hypothetical protein